MKINLLKINNGALVPSDTNEQDKLTKFANNEIYEAEIKLYRNPKFHSKMFVFFAFCFDHWAADNTDFEFMDENGQREVFRNHLTVLAGFYKKYYNLEGEVRVEADSLSYGSMDQDKFEKCYKAIVNAALRTVFKGSTTVDENKLLSFF